MSGNQLPWGTSCLQGMLHIFSITGIKGDARLLAPQLIVNSTLVKRQGLTHVVVCIEIVTYCLHFFFFKTIF